MAKLAVTGHDASKLIDCVRLFKTFIYCKLLKNSIQSEAVPLPVPAVKKAATFPAGTGPQLVQSSCNKPFPVLKTDPGVPTTIPEVSVPNLKR